MSGYLLDTNVLIDAARRVPAVLDWLAAADDQRLFTSAVVIGELHRGFCRKPGGAGDRWLLESFLPEINERVLPFDTEAAILWGTLMADGEIAGRRPASDDAKLAATALLHELTLVTHNIADFRLLPVATLDPHRVA